MNILETVLQDLTVAVRTMRKNSALTLTMIASLALAIGANTAIYSLINASMLRPLPVPEPNRLVTLSMPAVAEPGGQAEEQDIFSYPLYVQFREGAANTARLAAFGAVEQTEAKPLDANAAAERITRQFISGEGFAMLGVHPVIGHLFGHDEEATIGGHPVAVLSYEYWRRRFNGDPRIIGQVPEPSRNPRMLQTSDHSMTGT